MGCSQCDRVNGGERGVAIRKTVPPHDSIDGAAERKQIQMHNNSFAAHTRAHILVQSHNKLAAQLSPTFWLTKREMRVAQNLQITKK